MKTRHQLLVAGMLLATSEIGVARADKEFARLPDLTNNATTSFGCAWGDHNSDRYLDLLIVGGKDTPRKPGLFHNDGLTSAKSSGKSLLTFFRFSRRKR